MLKLEASGKMEQKNRSVEPNLVNVVKSSTLDNRNECKKPP